MRRRGPSCRLYAPPTFTDALIPAEAATALGVLRRPQTQAEAPVVAAPGRLSFPPGEVRPSSRIVRAFPDGTQLRLFVLRSAEVSTVLERRGHHLLVEVVPDGSEIPIHRLGRRAIIRASASAPGAVVGRLAVLAALRPTVGGRRGAVAESIEGGAV